MNYLAQLTEDEVRYICSVIPQKDAISYFQHNPKQFSKICPGFRASGIAKFDTGNLLFRNRNNGFVSFFIEKHISDWLSQIQEHIEKCLKDGDSKEVALLNTLPFCFFVDNIEVYFKLINEDYSEEYITLLSSGIKLIKNLNSKQEKLDSALNEKASDAEKQRAVLERLQSDLAKAEEKLSNSHAEVKILKNENVELKNLKDIIKSKENTIECLKSKVQGSEEHIQQLKNELSTVKENQRLLETQIREEIERQQKINFTKSARNPKRPIDIDEFKDYLGYNFESIGIPADAEYFVLLKEHLSEILFQGKPIIVARSIGMNLMKCISNALAGTPFVETLSFSSEISEQTIDEFFTIDSRIVCLDNFIGNFNETVLLTLCDQHKDKIIFLATTYDRTLYFMPEEFMKYCHYLNLNRIEMLNGNPDITEDPSSFDEEEISNLIGSPASRWSHMLNELLRDFRLSGALSVHKSAFVSDEQSLCRLLAFDILPYCIDVLQISPFNASERLIKYAGDVGRCLYKDLFRRWFA